MLRLLAVTFRWLVVASACAYPILVLGAILLLRFADESWFATVLLYSPRQPFLLPIPFLALGLWLAKRTRLLWTQALASGLVLFPLMGFVLPSFSVGTSRSSTMRVLSFNIDSGYQGVDRIAQAILRADATIVLVQEGKGGTDRLIELLSKKYPFVANRPYSLVFSQFPFLETSDHSKLAIEDDQRSPRFQRHVVKTPAGPVAVYNVHPISPRGTMNLYRFRGAFFALRTGQLVNSDSIQRLAYNVRLRRLQIEAVAKLARQEPHPAIVAGDFNLPELSHTFHANLGGFSDSFRTAGAGFGYTFPSRLAWMRLDRVLTTQHFRAVDFRVDCEGLSDHRCVVATLARVD